LGLAEGNRREKKTERRSRGRADRPGFSKDRHDPEANAFRIRSELAPLEKAYSQKDFAKQKASLEEILKQLKPLRLRSIDQLDFNTRGRLITTLLRVGRQTAPAAPVAGSEKPVAADATSEPASIPSAPPDVPQPEEEPAAASEEKTEVGVASESVPAATAAPPAEKTSPPGDEKAAAFAEMMFVLGSIWRAVGDQRRAALAFAASGREADQEQAVEAIHRTGDWREETQLLENQKRTRDAARVHEHHQSFAEAARLFEAGNDFKSALGAAVVAKDWVNARRLLKMLPPDASQALLEKAGAYELLMEFYVETSNFQNVARLYERARQFDQAALAWERAGKLGNARKAFERAKDAEGAQRIRQLEVEELVKRGDRLGAAVLLLGENRREEAVSVLLPLPPAKAFRFLQKVKLDDEAMALARREIQQAESENKPSVKARWLEWTGDALAAAEAWDKADRKDKALEMYEQVGQWQKAAQVAEALGRKEKALELYHRAGDRVSATRLEISSLKPADEQPPTSAE
jgi:tetratricopeptide (TPR) repeat protein